MIIEDLPKTIVYARFTYAAAALIAPKTASRVLGLPSGKVNFPTRAWAGLFASREAALGAMTLQSEPLSPELRRKVLLLNTAVDGLDAISATILARRHRSLALFACAVPFALASAASHFAAAQQLTASEPSDQTICDDAVSVAVP